MRPRLVGINHVALEVDDIEQALDFYGMLFELKGVERERGGAFVDLGDQFLALFEPGSGEDSHFGLVVDDKEAARRVLEAAGAAILPGRRLDFRDPFRNRVQVVQYDQIQFAKSQRVLAGMGLALGKTEQALAELRARLTGGTGRESLGPPRNSARDQPGLHRSRHLPRRLLT